MYSMRKLKTFYEHFNEDDEIYYDLFVIAIEV